MKLTLKEIILFPILAVMMATSRQIMAALPNFHLLGVLIVTFTVVFRWKALIPIYIYVFLDGIALGFNISWIPYIYIWTVLWAIVMLIPNFKSKTLTATIYIIVCGLHGFLFGTLYAPAQALLFGFNLEQTLAWIAAGFPFDIIHGISNILLGTLIYPLVQLLKKITKIDKKT